jgi:hypothetical protein
MDDMTVLRVRGMTNQIRIMSLALKLKILGILLVTMLYMNSSFLVTFY